MSEPSSSDFLWHEKYHRHYRDFESGGRWYRQYDNDKGAWTEIPPPKSIPRSVPAQNPAARDQYSGGRPSIQQTSLQPTNSAALHIGLDQRQAATKTDDTQIRDPWGLSQSPPEPTRPGHEKYALEGGAPKREASQMRTDFGYPEQTVVKSVEAAEGDYPGSVTPHDVSRQQEGHDNKHPWTESHSNRSQPERKRRTSLANPTKSGAGSLARQLKSEHIDQPIDAHGGEDDRQHLVPQPPQSTQYQYSVGDYNSRPQLTSSYLLDNETVANQTNQPQWTTPRDFSTPNQPVASAGIAQTQQPYRPSPYTADLASGGGRPGHESAGSPTSAPSMENYALQPQGKADVSNPVSPDTPQDLGGKGYTIRTTAGEKEFDSRYVTRKDGSRFFRVGRVFALLWPEAVGSDGTALSEKYQGQPSGFTKGRFNQPIYTSIRRMFVVREVKGHCWCLPISTYNNRGTTKRGLDPTSHAIIYMSNSSPQRLAGETEMTKEPLSVDPAPSQKLDKLSRLNFDKVYTVEHNVRLMDIGKVSKASMPKLVGYWENHRDRK